MPFINRDRLRATTSAKGRFVPGEDFVVTTKIQGLRGTAGSRFAIRTSHSAEGKFGHSDRLIETLAVAPGAVVTRTTTLRFEKPGYYHVMAYVATTADGERQEDSRQGVPVAPVATSSMWILVNSDGGRVDAEYDDRLRTDSTRVLAEGVLGAFISPKGYRGSARMLPSNEVPPQPTQYSTREYHGRVTYQFFNPSNGTFQTRTIEDLQITTLCIRDDNEIVGSWVTTTNILGEFSVTCPVDQTFQISVSASLQAAGVVVRSHQNRYAGAGGAFWADEYAGERVDFPVNNNQAAQVFKNHVRYASQASSLFGRTRPPITYRVSNSTTGIAKYEPSGDFIRLYTDNVWGRPGLETTVHEYGHAFHYVAIDPWSTYVCSPDGNHGPGAALTTSCAYIEGFANFFAARVINAVDGSSSNTDQLSQQRFEENNWRLIGHNGLLDEGMFAALLLDVVDGNSDDDGIPGDDDSMSLSLFELTQIMNRCRLWSPSTGLLSHSDQFVYCAVSSVAERTHVPAPFMPSWGVYGSVSYDSPVVLPLSSAFRAAWLRNLYNQ